MKVRNIIFNLALCLTTFFFGVAWVGVYQFFLGNQIKSTNVQPSNKVIGFDINDPDSVLPIDFEEEKLTSPKTDETNEAYFDPEGYYYFLDEPPKGFEDFKHFNINNKNFDVDPKDRRYGEAVPPSGFIILIDKNKGTHIRFEKLDISNGRLYFQANGKNGLSYKFEGEFLVKGNFYTLDENAKVLEGILIKKKAGKTVAESRVVLGWGIDF